jgi:hypothetical protein
VRDLVDLTAGSWWRGHRGAGWRWLGGLLVLLLQAGCLYRFTPSPRGAPGKWDPAIRPAPPAVDVVTAEQVDRPYKTVGIVHAPGAMGEQDALALLKQKAQALRGDALLNVRRRRPAGASAGAYTPWDAEVIVWTDHQDKVVPPPPPGGSPHPSW